MDINREKLDIIEMLMNIDDEKILLEVKSTINKHGSFGAKNYLTPDQEENLMQILDESEEDIKNGRVHSHEEVVKYFTQKFKRKRA